MAYFGANSNNTYELLTPKAFEVTKPPEDISRRLTDALTEIGTLKQENELLQKQKKLQAEKLNLSLMQPHLGQTDSILNLECRAQQFPFRTQPQLESLVTHQAAEIAKLRQQMSQLTADDCNQLKLLEDIRQKEIQDVLHEHRAEIRNLKYHHHAETNKRDEDVLKKQEDANLIISLASELKHKEKMFETQVSALNRDHQSEVETLQNAREHLQKEMDELNKEYKTKTELLQQNLEDLKKSSESQILQLQQELSSKTLESKNQIKQITRLKTYIGESENIPKSAEILRTENNTLKNKLNICIAEKEHIQSHVELLNIRLSSMTEILGLQETELSQDKLGERNKEKQENSLLRRWREKVFALLVQHKSARIVLKKDENNWKEKMSNLQNQLESAENQIQIHCHSLSDKQAQLDISNNNNNRVQNDLLETQQQMDLLSNQSTNDQKMLVALKNFTLSVGSKFQEQFQHFEVVNRRLASFGQRISFAGNRVLLLQNVIAKQKYMSKLHQQQQQTEIPTKDDTEESSSELSDDSVPFYAKTELVQLQKERDLLGMQLTEIMQEVDERIQAKENKYKEQEIDLKKELLETQNSLQAESDKCQSLAQQLEVTENKLEEKNNEVESLKTELSNKKTEIKQTLDEFEQKHNELLAVQFAEMDKKINDARRQHIKAEISLRQAERQQEHSQASHAEQQKKVEEYYEHQIMELSNQLKDLEAERNLMMATLRQEGIIGKLKFDCLPPQHDVTSSVNRMTTETLPEVANSNLKDKETPLEMLLEDVKQISSDILEDSSDESLS